MVAHVTIRTFGVNHEFRFVEGFGYIKKVVKPFSEKTYFISCVRNMFWATILNKYHVIWYAWVGKTNRRKITDYECFVFSSYFLFSIFYFFSAYTYKAYTDVLNKHKPSIGVHKLTQKHADKQKKKINRHMNW